MLERAGDADDLSGALKTEFALGPEDAAFIIRGDGDTFGIELAVPCGEDPVRMAGLIICGIALSFQEDPEGFQDKMVAAYERMKEEMGDNFDER